MKYGVQVTTTDDGAWSVSQIVQTIPNKEFTRTGGIVFVDHSKSTAERELVDAIKNGLSGSIQGASDV